MTWSESCSVVSNSLWPQEWYSPWISPGQNTGVGTLSLLQGIFSTQGLNPGLLPCRQFLYQLSHKESPRKLECVTYRSSSGSSCRRYWNQGLLHCRWILYQLCYQGSPTISVLFIKQSGWQFLLNSIKQWEIFPSQAWNLGLLHCRQILYLLSHQEAQSNGNKLIFKVQRSLIFLSSCYFPNASHRKLHFRCTVVWVECGAKNHSCNTRSWIALLLISARLDLLTCNRVGGEIQDLIHAKCIQYNLAGGVYYLNVSPFC